MSLRPVKTDSAPQPVGPYSQGIVAGGFLFTAGQVALDPKTSQVVAGDIKAQTERVLANLTGVLAAGGASWRHVVKTSVFLADMNDFPAMNEVYARVLGDARPVRTTVAVAGLPRGVLVEIDAIAELP